MKTRRIVAVLLALILFASMFPMGGKVLAAGDAQITVTTSATDVQPGDDVTFTVKVSNVTDLSAWRAELFFDSTKLTVKEKTMGGLFLSSDFLDFSVMKANHPYSDPAYSAVPTSYDKRIFANTTVLATPEDEDYVAPNYNEPYFTVTFTVLEGATGDVTPVLACTTADFFDSNFVNIPFTITQADTVTVGSGSTECEHDIQPVAKVESTCKVAGVEAHYECTKCGKLFTDAAGENETTLDDLALELADHTPGEPVTSNVVPPTCITDGSHKETVSCTVCGTVISAQTVTDLATGIHTPTRTDMKDSTCKETGYEAYWTCSQCNKLFSDEACTKEITEPQEIALKDHTPGAEVHENQVDATCAADGGYDKVVYCTVCGDEISREHVTVSKETVDHTIIHKDRVEPNCGNPGMEEHFECSVCGLCFSDEAGQNVVTAESLELAPNGVHQYDEANKYKANETDGDCMNKATYDWVVECEICHEIITLEAGVEGDYGAHNLSKTDKVDSTCTETGTEAFWTCSICHKLYSDADATTEITAPIVIDLKDHTPGEVQKENVVKPKCTTAGSHSDVIYCTVCNNVIERTDNIVDPAPGHQESDPVQEHYVAATCKEDGGYDNIVYCTVCGEVLSSNHVTLHKEDVDHTWGDWEVTTYPTKDTVGSRTRTCTVCGAEDVDNNYAWVEYEIIEGANGTWEQGSTYGLSFTSNAAFALYDSVIVDGNVVSNATATEGSTKVFLSADFLATLALGEHEITVVSKDGEATTKFTVVEKTEEPSGSTNESGTSGTTSTSDTASNTSGAAENKPATGDSNEIFLLFAILFVSGFTAYTFTKKKEQA